MCEFLQEKRSDGITRDRDTLFTRNLCATAQGYDGKASFSVFPANMSTHGAKYLDAVHQMRCFGAFDRISTVQRNAGVGRTPQR
jgi:hypothetical protein